MYLTACLDFSFFAAVFELQAVCCCKMSSDNTFKRTWHNEDAYFYSGTLGESDCSSLMSSRHNEVICKTGDGSQLLLRALSPFLVQVSPLYL